MQSKREVAIEALKFGEGIAAFAQRERELGSRVFFKGNETKAFFCVEVRKNGKTRKFVGGEARRLASKAKDMARVFGIFQEDYILWHVSV